VAYIKDKEKPIKKSTKKKRMVLDSDEEEDYNE